MWDDCDRAVTISAIIVVIGSIIGCPVLSIISGINLNKYRKELIILLVGGGFFAMVVIEQVILTVMRKQQFLLLGFVIASITAMICSNPMVKVCNYKVLEWHIQLQQLFYVQYLEL